MKKKLISLLTITSSICALIPFNCLNANAVKNNWDSEWKGGTGYCYGEFGGIHSLCAEKYETCGRDRACCIRPKGDTSSIYVYNKSSKSVKVTVWGENSYITPARKTASATECSGYTKISTNVWSVPKYSERFIPQYIKENRYTYAHAHFDTSGTSGLWSSDSSGWYPNATATK